MQQPLKQLYSHYDKYLASALSIYGQKPDLRKYLELFLSLGTISIFLLFAVKPTVVTIIGLTKEIKAKQQTLKAMNTKIENLKKAQNVYFQQKVNLDLLALALPDTPSPEIFARQLEAASYLNSISLNGMTFSETVLRGKNNLKRSKEEGQELPAKTLAITISLNGRGNYQAINNFVTNLEDLKRLFKIDTVNISKKVSTKNDQEEQGLLISLSGRLPYFNSEEK